MKNLQKTILATSLLIGNASIADDNKFYLGGGYSISQASYSSSGDYFVGNGLKNETYFNDKFHGVNVFAGYQYSESNAFELGYTHLLESGKSATTTFNGLDIASKTDISINKLDLDYINSLKLGESGASILALAGIGVLSVNRDVTIEVANATLSESKSEIGYSANLGLGLEYDINETIAMRVLAKHSFVRGIDSAVDKMDGLSSGNVGIKFKF